MCHRPNHGTGCQCLFLCQILIMAPIVCISIYLSVVPYSIFSTNLLLLPKVCVLLKCRTYYVQIVLVFAIVQFLSPTSSLFCQLLFGINGSGVTDFIEILPAVQ